MRVLSVVSESSTCKWHIHQPQLNLADCGKISVTTNLIYLNDLRQETPISRERDEKGNLPLRGTVVDEGNAVNSNEYSNIIPQLLLKR